jgi:hypothetical protein
MSNPSEWKMTSSERAIVEGAIGSATLDKARGQNTTLTMAYAAKGGHDPDSLTNLRSFQQKFAGANISNAVRAVAPQGDFNQAYTRWNMSHDELDRVQRAIGRAMLSKIEGAPATIQDIYKELGGHQPDALDALQKLDPHFAKANPASLRS